jgi:hypothetical protein
MSVALSAVPLWAAVLPLAAYFLGLALLHARRRPSVVSGQLDALLLAAAVSGLVIAGPLALLQPAAGTSVWTAVLLLVGFLLLVALCLLASRPRVVVYNASLEQVRPLVAEVVAGLDATARWAGETAALPARGLQLHLDARGPARTVSIVAGGGRAAAESWAEFSRRLRRAVRSLRVRTSPWAWGFAALGAAVLAAASWLALSPRPATAPRPESSAPGASHAGPRRSLDA